MALQITSAIKIVPIKVTIDKQIYPNIIIQKLQMV